MEDNKKVGKKRGRKKNLEHNTISAFTEAYGLSFVVASRAYKFKEKYGLSTIQGVHRVMKQSDVFDREMAELSNDMRVNATIDMKKNIYTPRKRAKTQFGSYNTEVWDAHGDVLRLLFYYTLATMIRNPIKTF